MYCRSSGAKMSDKDLASPSQSNSNLNQSEILWALLRSKNLSLDTLLLGYVTKTIHIYFLSSHYNLANVKTNVLETRLIASGASYVKKWSKQRLLVQESFS